MAEFRLAAGRGPRHGLVAACALLWLVLISSQVAAVDLTPPLPTPELQQRYYNLTHELRCMQCQNEALADSTVGLAADLRQRVHELLAAGKSDEQIRDYMVARYGDFILFRPRVAWRNAWLWAAPAVFLVLGLMAVLRILRRRAAMPVDDGAESGAGDPM